MNAAIQPLQSGLRSLIVDVCPAHQQQMANAWAARVINGANVLSYSASFVRLPQVLLTRPHSRFRILCSAAAIILLLAVTITCSSVRELQEELCPVNRETSIWRRLRIIHSAFDRLPQRTRAVFRIQFCAWFSWFPFLFYANTYISERCKYQIHKSPLSPPFLTDNRSLQHICRREHHRRILFGSYKQDWCSRSPCLCAFFSTRWSYPAVSCEANGHAWLA